MAFKTCNRRPLRPVPTTFNDRASPTSKWLPCLVNSQLVPFLPSPKRWIAPMYARLASIQRLHKHRKHMICRTTTLATTLTQHIARHDRTRVSLSNESTPNRISQERIVFAIFYFVCVPPNRRATPPTNFSTDWVRSEGRRQHIVRILCSYIICARRAS